MTVLRNAASSAGAGALLPMTAPAWRKGAAPSAICRPIRGGLAIQPAKSAADRVDQAASRMMQNCRGYPLIGQGGGECREALRQIVHGG